MIATTHTLETLKRRRPEWSPWLLLVEEIVRESTERRWDAVVPEELNARDLRAPLLAGAAISIGPGDVQRLFDRLLRLASAADAPAMAGLTRVRPVRLDLAELFVAAVRVESDGIAQVATNCGVDAEAFQAVVALLPVPLLQAVNRRHSHAVSPSWLQGYCPVCAAWPAFAELRGIERTRHFRCARCGSEWAARALVCPYCEMDDHNELVALVPAVTHAYATVDACKRCGGYVKVLTCLQGCPPAVVMLEDLAHVDLDLAALEQGYTRPAGLKIPLDVTVQAARRERRLFGWRS